MKISRTQIEIIIIGILLLILVVHSLNIPIENPLKVTSSVEVTDDTAQAAKNTETLETSINNTEKSTNPENIQTKVYTGNGVSFEYPDSWSVSTEEFGDDNIIIVHKKDNTHLQVQITHNSPLSEEDIKDTVTFYPGWTKISNKTIPINGLTAYMDVYEVYSIWPPLWDYKLETITFIKNRNLYTVDLQAPSNEFNQEPFDLIINSFKVQ